ncbi:hypothetical protein PROFUN_12420 [Planoprotostelium fungivorum]|uniref:Uncharacterized protein n=1 Tax=Planoprotostelium fungivorum TaxID=1890364 RepID=A0A2P6N5Q1_9EUKA|nr:hypothetical protein PROFUN_12420 [Planoprotostelium fungivorum]
MVKSAHREFPFANSTLFNGRHLTATTMFCEAIVRRGAVRPSGKNGPKNVTYRVFSSLSKRSFRSENRALHELNQAYRIRKLRQEDLTEAVSQTYQQVIAEHPNTSTYGGSGHKAMQGSAEALSMSGHGFDDVETANDAVIEKKDSTDSKKD